MLTNQVKTHVMVTIKTIFKLKEKNGDKKEIDRLSEIRRRLYDNLTTFELMELEKYMPPIWKY